MTAFNDAIQKINTVITNIGYPDCGYNVFQVVPGEGSKYNWVLQGNWKNPGIYKTIHENEEFKKVFEEGKRETTPYFKGQIYLKVTLP